MQILTVEVDEAEEAEDVEDAGAALDVAEEDKILTADAVVAAATGMFSSTV